MFEGIWNALNSWQRFEATVLMGIIVVGIVTMMILNRSELKRKFKKNRPFR